MAVLQLPGRNKIDMNIIPFKDVQQGQRHSYFILFMEVIVFVPPPPITFLDISKNY